MTMKGCKSIHTGEAEMAKKRTSKRLLALKGLLDGWNGWNNKPTK